MNRDFDFDDIGKKTPYRAPDNFFDEVQQKIVERTYGGKLRKRHRLQVLFSTAIAVAAVLAGVLFVLPHYRVEAPETSNMLVAVERSSGDPADDWIHELSDEELEELVNFSENDIFLN